MDGRTTVLAVSIGYLVLSLVVGMWPGKKSSDSAAGYVAGDRTLGLVVMYFITGASIFSAFAFLGGPGWTYSKGAAAFYILGYGALGFVPFYFLGPRAARLGRRFGFVTQAEMVAARFGSPALAGVMAVISVVAFIPYLALQMLGAGYVLYALTDHALPTWAGAGLVYLVVLAYVLKSGVLGVGWTNTLQGLFMMVLAWGLGLYLPDALYGGVGPLFDRLAAERPELLLAPGLSSSGDPWTWGEYTSAVGISIIGFCMWPHLFMKAFTAKNEQTIRRTVVLYPTFQIFLVPLFLIGYCGVFFEPGPELADQVLPHMLMQMQQQMDLPAIVVGLFCAGALAASMSSGDAMVHAAASIAVRDGWVAAWRKGEALDAHVERRLIRIVLVLVMLAAYLVAVLYDGSLVFLLLSTYGAVVQFAPAVWLGLSTDRVSGRAVLAGMVSGSLVTALLIALPALKPFAIHSGVYGLLVNVVVVLVGSRVWPEDAERAARFLRVARGGAAPETWSSSKARS